MKHAPALSLLLLAAGSALAAPAPLPATSAPGTILGLRPGMDRDDADAALKPLGTTPGMADEDAKDKVAPKAAKAGGDEEEGHSELWTLRGTPYAQIVVKADPGGHVSWVTGFVRPGQEIPFARFGDTKTALVFRDGLAVWNVPRPGAPYRLIARGMKGRARSVSLISLAPPKAH